MVIYPAISISGGQCEEFSQGLFKGKVDPLEAAKKFESLGAKYIHLVDKDRIINGTTENIKTIKDIISQVKLSVQVSGGIKSLEEIADYLDSGAKRVAINAADDESITLLEKAVEKYNEKIVAELTLRDRKIVKDGTNQFVDVPVIALAQKLESIGVNTIIYTDLDRTGTLKGSDIVGVTEILSKVFVNIIAAGGINDIIDAKRLQRLGASGVIIGKALFTGDIDLSEILV